MSDSTFYSELKDILKSTSDLLNALKNLNEASLGEAIIRLTDNLSRNLNKFIKDNPDVDWKPKLANNTKIYNDFINEPQPPPSILTRIPSFQGRKGSSSSINNNIIKSQVSEDTNEKANEISEYCTKKTLPLESIKHTILERQLTDKKSKGILSKKRTCQVSKINFNGYEFYAFLVFKDKKLILNVPLRDLAISTQKKNILFRYNNYDYEFENESESFAEDWVALVNKYNEKTKGQYEEKLSVKPTPKPNVVDSPNTYDKIVDDDAEEGLHKTQQNVSERFKPNQRLLPSNVQIKQPIDTDDGQYCDTSNIIEENWESKSQIGTQVKPVNINVYDEPVDASSQIKFTNNSINKSVTKKPIIDSSQQILKQHYIEPSNPMDKKEDKLANSAKDTYEDVTSGKYETYDDISLNQSQVQNYDDKNSVESSNDINLEDQINEKILNVPDEVYDEITEPSNNQHTEMNCDKLYLSIYDTKNIKTNEYELELNKGDVIQNCKEISKDCFAASYKNKQGLVYYSWVQKLYEKV